MSTSWAPSHLTSLEHGFQALVRRPAALALDCRGIAGLPRRIVPLHELRRRLTDVDHPVSRATGDAVWRELLVRARSGERGWMLAAAGMAVPGLRVMAGRLARRWQGDLADLDADLVTGFVERMSTISLDAERICGKLLDAAQRAAQRSYRWADDPSVIDDLDARSIPPQWAWGHPDLILARAVAGAFIDIEEYWLIGETRLGDVPLQIAAEDLEMPVKHAAWKRRTAECRLTAAIIDGDLDWVIVGTAAWIRTARSLDRFAAR